MTDGRSRAELERAVEGGDGDAHFALADRMLRQPEGPGDWPRAIDLFERAAAMGHAPATERCALFDAIGMRAPGDWSKALARMARSAELGHDAAGRALQALGASPSGQADMAALLRVPPARSLSERPLVRVHENFLSAGECDWLIAAARGRLAPASVYDSVANTHGTDPARSNRSAAFDFADLDLVIELVRTRISRAIGIPLGAFEATQILNYQVGQEFRPHVDYLDPASPIFADELARRGQRVVTFLVYLNDGFEGGATHFPKLGIDYRGRRGDAILFANVGPTGQPDPDTLHAGLPPTSGEKWLLSQWVRDRAPG